jgi:hypothetical protein
MNKSDSKEELISILCPTRSRPDNTTRLLKSIVDTVSVVTGVEVIFYLDNDDNLGQNGMRENLISFPQLRIKALVGPRITLSKMWNVCSSSASGAIQMHCGDDIVFKTNHWDRFVREKFEEYPDRIVFLHGTDGHNTTNFGTHGFLHTNWINTTGYFVPPYFSSDFNDTWLNDVGNALDRRVFIPILTQHLHPIFGDAELDQTHADRLIRHREDKVEELYVSKYLERELDILKLRLKIFDYQLRNR